jgi:hypothetical protein
MRVGAVNLLLFLLVVSAASAVSRKALDVTDFSEPTAQKIKNGKRLNRKERKEVGKAEKARYVEMRQQGAEEVANRVEANVLFPGLAPVEYKRRKALLSLRTWWKVAKKPFPMNTPIFRSRRCLGKCLQGHDLKAAPFDMRVKVSNGFMHRPVPLTQRGA